MAKYIDHLLLLDEDDLTGEDGIPSKEDLGTDEEEDEEDDELEEDNVNVDKEEKDTEEAGLEEISPPEPKTP